ncbi:HTH_Tnp_Tc3_2 domain-containing protein [Trichonephila clavipes]|nr:HTH_Tnp_Tc3_2 domain-containing protein [Trichonephila clavipes]
MGCVPFNDGDDHDAHDGDHGDDPHDGRDDGGDHDVRDGHDDGGDRDVHDGHGGDHHGHDDDVFHPLFKKGISYREIAKIVGRSHSCVQKIIGRFKSDGLIENKSGRGRKSMLSDVAKRKVLKDIRIDPKLSVVKLAAETSRIIGRCVSAETVRNLIRHAGYSSRVARKKPFISLQNQEKRLEFTKTHQLKTDNFWKKVIFSDESKFNFLEVMAVAPFGESRTPFWIQKIDVLQLNMVVTPSWFRVVWLQMG